MDKGGGDFMALKDELMVLINSKYPIIYVETLDEEYILNQIREAVSTLNFWVYSWSITKGLRIDNKEDSYYYGSNDPASMLKTLIYLVNNEFYPKLVIITDFHKYLEDQVILRLFKDLIEGINNSKSRDTIILLSPEYKIPQDIQVYAGHILAGYPSESEIKQFVEEALKEVTRFNNIFKVNLTPEELDKLNVTLKGLSLNQIRNFMNQAFSNNILDSEDLDTIRDLKKKAFDNEGILEFCITENMGNIAGFDNLKKWLRVRKSVFLSNSADLPAPKGLLLMGVQGCGKSLTIKAIAKEMDVPLYRLDLGKLYSSYIGQTEENLRKTLKIIDKLSPLCLWIDEIEKGLSVSDGQVDGGVSQRVLATFLTWMQERTGKCFIAATANQIHKLPPEFLRKGRFDEIFFVDLPDISVREELIKIHLKKRNYVSDRFDIKLLAEKTENYSGAEIEQAIISAIYNTVTDKKDLDTTQILDQINSTKPLAVIKEEEVMVLREWAKNKTIPV